VCASPWLPDVLPCLSFGIWNSNFVILGVLIFDQLKKNDPQLRLLALVVFAGLLILLAGLWWVQVVSARDYQARLETQSFRTVRVPAVRGEILDSNGAVLADNRPTYNVCLYLEELRRAFDAAYTTELANLRDGIQAQIAEQERKLGRALTQKERNNFKLTAQDHNLLRERARCTVASNIVTRLSWMLRQPVTLDEAKFSRHYTEELALPFPVLANLDPAQVARFEEQSVNLVGLDLELQPVRFYPGGTTAAHLLGQLRRDISSVEGEDAFFNYPLPVYRGTVGIEAGFDRQLRGRAGAKSVLVNNLGYRQTESIWTEAQPGENVVLTIDLAVQQAAEKALLRLGGNTRAAVVVLDPRNGDVLALVSSPTYDPNLFVQGVTRAEWERLNDEKLRPQINRATQVTYAPGSAFKIVTALACLETGLNPSEKIYNPPSPSNPAHGYIQVGRRLIHDLAPPGEYDFRRAIIKSCNTYFITNGLKAGIQNIVRIAQRMHLAERTGLPTRQEAGGTLPSLKRVSANWFDGDTANVCIGQGPVAVTPLQVAVATAAIANGGKVFWPRLVKRIEPQDSFMAETKTIFPPGRVRDELGVQPRSLQLLWDAMLADVEDPESTAYAAFHQSDRTSVKAMRICGKTGTAQVMNELNQVVDQTTWFVSFGPYEQPRYVVVVMVESGGSGGGTCAPVARDIYTALERFERSTLPQQSHLVQAQ
jgi:penicillin-binding protein 2